jgi:hypothetical protein
MAMAAMIAEEGITRTEMLGKSYPSPLLSDTGVDGSKESTLAEQLEEAFLKETNPKRLFKKTLLG